MQDHPTIRTALAGTDLSTALRELKREVPNCDRLIFSANGKLEITGFSSVNFQGLTIHIPCDTRTEGTLGISSFELLYRLSQDKDFKASELFFDTREDRLLLNATIRQELRYHGKKYHQDAVAEYRFETCIFPPPANIAPVTKDEPEETPAPVATEPSGDLLQFVTVPSVMIKGYLPRARSGSVTIASTNSGVMLIQHRESSHILTAEQPARFYHEVPVQTLRAACKTSDTLRIGIRGKHCEWNGLKDTHGHPDRRYINHGDPLPRQSYPFIETILGEVNGILVTNQRGEFREFHHDRHPATAVPQRRAIAYRDTLRVAGTTILRPGDTATAEDVFGPWRYVRELNTPPAIAEQIALRASTKSGRQIESVWLPEEQEIVLESEVRLEPQWEVLRVTRTECAGRKYKFYTNRTPGEWTVFATFKATNSQSCHKSGTCRVRIARDLTDELSKALTKDSALAARMLNGEINQQAAEGLLTAQLAKSTKKVETLFGAIAAAPRPRPVQTERVHIETPRRIPEAETINLFAE